MMPDASVGRSKTPRLSQPLGGAHAGLLTDLVVFILSLGDVGMDQKIIAAGKLCDLFKQRAADAVRRMGADAEIDTGLLLGALPVLNELNRSTQRIIRFRRGICKHGSRREAAQTAALGSVSDRIREIEQIGIGRNTAAQIFQAGQCRGCIGDGGRYLRLQRGVLQCNTNCLAGSEKEAGEQNAQRVGITHIAGGHGHVAAACGDVLDEQGNAAHGQGNAAQTAEDTGQGNGPELVPFHLGAKAAGCGLIDTDGSQAEAQGRLTKEYVHADGKENCQIVDDRQIRQHRAHEGDILDDGQP